MTTRIAFVIMSAVHSPKTVSQLARALVPHLVLVHHDFVQTPDFTIDAPNAVFVPDPERTGWACGGFGEGIFHALKHAVEHCSFDYLQLLSPTGLPIKPLHAFESHVATSACDVHFDCVDLFDERIRPCFGSVWFGARPRVLASMLERFSEPLLLRHFRGLRIADEFLIPNAAAKQRHAPRPCQSPRQQLRRRASGLVRSGRLRSTAPVTGMLYPKIPG